MAYRLAKSLVKLRDQINAIAPVRSKASDGWIGDASHFATGSASDHNPWISFGGIGIVTGMDITHDPTHGCDVWEIAQAIAASKDSRLKYLIYTGGVGGKPGILSQTVSPWKWRERMSDDHPHHLHISVNSNSGDFDNTKSWSLSRYSQSSTTATEPDTEKIMSDLTLTNPLSKIDATAASGLNSIWAYSVMTHGIVKALAAKGNVDVDESAIASQIIASIAGPLKAAVVASLSNAGGSASPEAIADAVVAHFATALVGTTKP